MSSVDITGFVPIPANHSAGAGPASREDTPASSHAPSVKMKPAFSRVAAAEPVSGSASPAGGTERGKVAFGFAMKRKAEDGDGPSGSPKRR
jgi:U4/U6.U5 tri-snRNP-associated protein 1